MRSGCDSCADQLRWGQQRFRDGRDEWMVNPGLRLKKRVRRHLKGGNVRRCNAKQAPAE
jgi:hypothetical protein